MTFVIGGTAGATVAAAGIGLAGTIYSSNKSAEGRKSRKDNAVAAPSGDFTTSGSWTNGSKRIEGMDTSFVNRDEAKITGLATQQFNLGQALLQPGFAESRSTVSNALSSRKMGRTSTFANSMESLAGKEQTAYSSLLSNILQTETKDKLSRDQLAGTMETAGLNSRTSRYNSYMSYLAAKESGDAARDSGEAQGMGSMIGSVVGAMGTYAAAGAGKKV
ncbi:MAG: hypothetical protein NT030_06905 [Candidatus Saganbacteria bacterium]|nr:hypothetical protein [Candidatus Saganbacteria bacterium]